MSKGRMDKETMERLSIPWGKNETLDFSLPEGWRLKAVLQPDRPAELPKVEEELDRAMNGPIGSPPLRKFVRRGRTACVVIDDRTRPTPVRALLPRVIEELNEGGVRDADIVVLIGLGTHRRMTEEEIAERVGLEIVGRIRVVNHDCFDNKNNVYLGKTPTHGIPVILNRLVVEADAVVLIGCIEAHEQAGVGGGFKNLMPGVSGVEPIGATHTARFQRPERISLAGMPKARCRFRQVVDESGLLLGPKVFIVNTVLDPIRIVAVAAGDPLKAHQAGRAIYERMATVQLNAPADVVIAGACPLDIDLRVSMKACFNASAALKPGGLFIMVSATPDGLGDLRLPKRLSSSANWIIKNAPLNFLEPIATFMNASPDQAAGAVSLIKILKTAKAWLYLTSIQTGVPVLQNMGIEFFSGITALLERASEIKPQADVVALPQAGASLVMWE